MKYNYGNQDVILFPLLTSKSSMLEIYHKKIIFYVSKFANKRSIKIAIQKMFQAQVLFVNIINEKTKQKVFKGKPFNIQAYKKAIITLKPGSSINLGGFNI